MKNTTQKDLLSQAYLIRIDSSSKGSLKYSLSLLHFLSIKSQDFLHLGYINPLHPINAPLTHYTDKRMIAHVSESNLGNGIDTDSLIDHVHLHRRHQYLTSIIDRMSIHPSKRATQNSESRLKSTFRVLIFFYHCLKTVNREMIMNILFGIIYSGNIHFLHFAH